MIFKVIIALALVFGLTHGQNTVELPVTIRDFANKDGSLPQAHPDFNFYTGNPETKGIVSTTLGQDGKPVIVSTKGVVSSFASFNQWYNDVPGTNINIPYTLVLTETGPNTGVYAYDNQAFFPIDGQGWGDDLNGFSNHNYGFTVEVHTVFTYKAGQTFDFKGDDDIWIFINGQLVIDLGGPHPALAKSVNLDTLGLTVGKDYPLDIFYAERHVDLSTLKISTSIKLKPTCLAPQVYNAAQNTCDDCVLPQVYLASTKACGACNAPQVYTEATFTCGDCVLPQVYLASTKACGNCDAPKVYNAAKNTCDDCTLPQVYLASTKACGSCNAPRLYDSKTGACDTCPDGSARNFDGTCISDCPKSLQSTQDSLPICKFPCRSTQIYNVITERCRCDCKAPYTQVPVNGYQTCDLMIAS